MADATQTAHTTTLSGGHAASHGAQDDFPLLVGPKTETQRNTLRFMLVPVACWRINDVRFDFDSAFVLPEAKTEFAELGALRKRHQGAPVSIFGHADLVGDDAYNKALSGRRAEAIYAVLIRDPDRWEKISGQESQGHQWGVRSVQIMLAALGEDTGDATGSMNQQTKNAVTSFQPKNDLKPDGDPGPKTRKKLFRAYMDFLAGDVKLDAKADFLAQGGDAQGKGDFQGCSEFNPAMVFSKDEDADLKNPARKADRDEANSPNRRVLVLLFRPGSAVPAAKWPCPRASEGVAGCKKRFWSDGDKRRSPQAVRREFAKTRDTFACRFYHRLVTSSPCEGVGPITPQTLYLKLTFVDDHFAPSQEMCVIKYTLMGFSGKPVKLEISSPLHQGGSPIFSRELTQNETTDGDHTIEWDGKATIASGDLKDRFIHPLCSPYKVHLFHDAQFTGELETKVLYHSILLKKGPWTPDEAEPAKGGKDWVQFKLNTLGFYGGPVGKDTEDYLKKAVIRYKVNHKKFHQPLIGSYDDSIPGDLVAALDANENDRKFSSPDAVEDSSKKSDVLVEELSYERTSSTKDEFGSTRPPHDKERLNRPLIPIEAEIWIKKKDDSKVLAPEAVGPCRINWSHTDPDEDLSQQFGDTAAEPSKTKKFIEATLQQEQGRTGTNGDNCPIKFAGIRDAPDKNWKTPFFTGDVYIPYTVQEDAGTKVVFSTASVDKEKFPKRLGRAGVLLRPSYISGDDYKFHAEISFQGLTNQKDLEKFHGMTDDVKTHIAADTGTFTVRRFGKVVTSIDWPARTNDPEWDKIATEFKKSFLDVDVSGIETKKMSEVLTLKQYQDLVVAHTNNKDASKIRLLDDAMVGIDLPAQGNDDADTYKQTLRSVTHTNYNSKIQTPLGRLLSEVSRRDHPTGFIICNFLLHKPVNVKNNPKKGDNTVTKANTNFITWGGSIGLPDSVILLDQKDPDHVYYVVSHEMGHNLYLLHWENTGENNTANHDQNDHNCTMSYSDFHFNDKGHFAFQAPGVYSPHFCGKCNLAVRGWDVTHAGLKSKSKQKGAEVPLGPDQGKLIVQVETPLGRAIDGAEVEVMTVGTKNTGADGKADFGAVKAGNFDIKVRKHAYGPPPTGGNPWGAVENRIPAHALVAGNTAPVKVQLVKPESITFSHTPDSAAQPERIFKVNKADTSVDHLVRVTVVIPKAAGAGPGTQFPLKVDWTVEADAGNCPKANNGKDNTSIHFVAAPGFAATGTLKMDAATVTNDAGVAEIKLSASAVAGDKFRVTAVITDPFNPGKDFGKAQSPWFQVWKKLDYGGLYRMKTGANTGVDVGTLCVEANIQPAYTPVFTEYKKGAVHEFAYKEFVSDLVAPTAAQLPVHSTVRVRSDGADTRQVTISGTVVAADGKATAGSATVTLSGTANVTTAASFQKVTTVTVAGNAPGRTVTIEEATGTTRAIGTIAPGGHSVSPNFLFETAATVQTKAQQWADANEAKWATDLTTADAGLGAADYHLVGFAYLHPKHSGAHAGVTSFYTAYPAVRITIRGSTFHPDQRWSNFDGMNIGRMSALFLNVLEGGPLGGAYTKGVARHEIGHASDHVSFGPGDHCPQGPAVCLMNANSTAGDFCTVAADHSNHRARGWS